MNGQLILTILCAAFSWLLLWFMLARPQKWDSYLDKQYDNWAGRKLDSLGMNKQISKWEFGKSLLFKLLVALAAIGNSVAAVFIYRIGVGA